MALNLAFTSPKAPKLQKIQGIFLWNPQFSVNYAKIKLPTPLQFIQAEAAFERPHKDVQVPQGEDFYVDSETYHFEHLHVKYKYCYNINVLHALIKCAVKQRALLSLWVYVNVCLLLIRCDFWAHVGTHWWWEQLTLF